MAAGRLSSGEVPHSFLLMQGEEQFVIETHGAGASGVAEALSRRRFVGTVAAGLAVVGGASLFGTKASALDGVSHTSVSQEAARSISPYEVPSVSTESERASAPKRVLVVVDYQVDFVSGGVFGNIEPAIRIENALCDRVREYQEAGDIVIYTMDTHPVDRYQFTREASVNEPHCIPGTEGWEIYGKARELLTPEKAICILKGTYGSVDLPQVIQAIRNQGTNVVSIEIAGVSTTCRVLHNAILLYNFFPDLPLIMDRKTTAAYSDERTEEQLDELQMWGFFVKE